jgi:putative phage-type endonuclease
MDEQRSPQWFKAREGRVTGSSVGAILGLSPFMAPDDVMRRMVREYHGAESEFQGNAATQWGTMNEPGALVEYEMETGGKVELCGFYTHQHWLGASPDGLLGKNGLIEIKCPYSMRKGEGRFKSAKEQMHYYAQMQIQLFVTDRDFCDFYQWSPGKTQLEVVSRDDQFINESIPKLKAFHDAYLVEIKSPERHLVAKRAEFNAPQIIAEYDDTIEAIKLYEERKKELLDKLVEISGGRDAMFGTRKLTQVQRAGSIPYSKIVKEHLPHLDLEPFRGPVVEYWSLSSGKEK